MAVKTKVKSTDYIDVIKSKTTELANLARKTADDYLGIFKEMLSAFQGLEKLRPDKKGIKEFFNLKLGENAYSKYVHYIFIVRKIENWEEYIDVLQNRLSTCSIVGLRSLMTVATVKQVKDKLSDTDTVFDLKELAHNLRTAGTESEGTAAPKSDSKKLKSFNKPENWGINLQLAEKALSEMAPKQRGEIVETFIEKVTTIAQRLGYEVTFTKIEETKKK